MEEDQATCLSVSDMAAALQHTRLEDTAENGDSCIAAGEEGDREWTGEEMKLVEPCIELIKVCCRSVL